MRITTEGQITIPQNVRKTLGIFPETEVDFKEDNGKFYIIRLKQPKITGNFRKFRGIATVNMTTDEIMNLTRGM
ncbi:MAG: AbrB/MazE/SpoVT family DNA-binding domain-containing protein [Thiomargarita sp.]|nr:AbrB/MazE/SpoVT family DNA-binding domain-containing protein [Thiomargarita sp.]